MPITIQGADQVHSIVRDTDVKRVLVIVSFDPHGDCGEEEGIQKVRWCDLDAETVLLADPEMILSPLVAEGFDCVDVAFRLAEFGYTGRYRAMTENLPHPAIVRREIRSLCPQLDFDIVKTDRQSHRLQ